MGTTTHTCAAVRVHLYCKNKIQNLHSYHSFIYTHTELYGSRVCNKHTCIPLGSFTTFVSLSSCPSLYLYPFSVSFSKLKSTSTFMYVYHQSLPFAFCLYNMSNSFLNSWLLSFNPSRCCWTVSNKALVCSN